MAFSPDGKTILTGSMDYRSGSGTRPQVDFGAALFGIQGGIYAVAFSPDGKTILTGSEDKTAKLWKCRVPWRVESSKSCVWTQVITGMKLDDNNVVRSVEVSMWRHYRQRLTKLGGPPRQSNNGR